MCVPGFTVSVGRGLERPPACVTRSHTLPDQPHPMCKLGCMLLTLREPIFLRLKRSADEVSCRAAAAAVFVPDPPEGQVPWFDGLRRDASTAVSVSGPNGARGTLLLFDSLA